MRIKQGDWVKFTSEGSIRNGLIGTIAGAVTGPPLFISVFFPMLGQSWNCNVRKLTPASEEEIAITIAREALGHQYKGWLPEVPEDGIGNVQISQDDLTDGMMRGRGTPLERGRIR